MTSITSIKYAAAVLVYDEINGLVLGVSRKDNPNIFGLCGGKVETGESFIEAAARECIEETGLVPYSMEYVYEEICGDTRRGDVLYYTVTYRAKVTGSINTTESDRVDWVTPKKLVEGCFGAYNKELFDKLGISYT